MRRRAPAEAAAVPATVGLVGAWLDPTDPRTWSGMFANVIAELRAMEAFAGYRDAGPFVPLARAAHRWATATGHDGGTWPLRPEMRVAACCSAPVVRRRPPRSASAWIVPAGTLGRPVAEPEVAWCELAPAQLNALGARDAAAFGLPGVTDRQLRAVVRAHLRLHRRAVASCTVSTSAARSLVHDHGLDPARVHVVGCGRNIEPTGPVAHDWTVPRFLFVGNDWSRKNGDAVVRAFARLRCERPDAQLDVVGGHPRLGVEGAVGHGQLRLDRPADRVRLAGLFSAATCLVVPSLSEPFGIVYVEAAAFGVPSIAGLVGGTATAVGDGGLLVDPRSDGAILDAMRRLADPPTAGRLGGRARRRSVRFTWRQVAERLLRAAGLPHPHGAPLADFLDDAGAGAPDDAVADVTDRPELTGTAPTGTAPTGTAPHAMSAPTIRPSTVREVRP